MAITEITKRRSAPQQTTDGAVDIVAIHDLNEDGVQTWTDPKSQVLWLRDLLPDKLHHFRVLLYNYNSEAFTSPGACSSNPLLTQATSLVAELCADRELEDAFDRPIIFVCHGFGGLLAKRALAYSSSREAKAIEHQRSIYTCTYGILFFGTPHNGISADSVLAQSHPSSGPTHFMLNLRKGSEMLNEINDQFAPLMKQFSIFNYWEELETKHGNRRFYVVDQDSAAPAWDNVEKCGIMATHSTMIKFPSISDRRFRPVLEALTRYARRAPALVKSRWIKDAELIDRKRQQEVEELLHVQRHHLLQADSYPSDYNQWCVCRRKPDPYFTGREKHLIEVKNMLGPIRKHGDQTSTKVLVIYGLGGSGKTQFCLKYVEDNKQRYWGVFWIDASSEKTVESEYAVIGTQAGRGTTMASTLHWLSQCRQPWLLILDNADDPESDISAYYPSQGNGHVIVTTRNPNAVEHATVGHIRFRGMEPHEAVTLLLKAAYPKQHRSSNMASPTSPKKWHLAEGIAVELGYLPLAIQHAGATIRRNIYTLERYLTYYLPHRKYMLSRSSEKSVDELNITSTWEIPFEKVVSRGSLEHRDAVDLMHLFAFMHHETIPERIFQRSWYELRYSKYAPKRLPDILPPVWSEAEQARFRRAIRVLCDYSIIEYEPTQGSCTIHPVVHDWARDRLAYEQQTHWLQCTMAILAQCISPNLEASGRQFRALLLPHINSCLKLHKHQNPRKSETLKTAAELERFAWVYAEQGQWKHASHLQEIVIRIRKKKLGSRHEDTIRAQRSLAQSRWNLFEIRSTIELQRGIMNVLRWRRPHLSDWAAWPIWKPRHIPYCLALSDISLTLWLAGLRDLSKMAGEGAVDGLKMRLGPEDPMTLTAMFNLARTYLHLREFSKCRELLVWVIKYQKRFFGLNHPDTLMTRNELGILLCETKRNLSAAQRLVENVLNARKKILGEEHAYTLWSINDLSKVYIERGRPDKAVALLESVVPVVKRTLGPHHVGMAMTRSNLGKAYVESGKWKEAEETVRPLLTVMPSHMVGTPDWIYQMYGYAYIQFKLGNLQEAEKYCVDVLDKVTRKRPLLNRLPWQNAAPLTDPYLIKTGRMLVSIYRHQGQEEKIAAIRIKLPVAELNVTDPLYVL
ncbi:uncharacterized protein EI97DRAFT_430135 [Westerdykella ornata]|uniref:NB-ARC domain-containing protein n=1 Tax=Westerdykella ornata TaxID=318751 RepID=A0A6A6JUV4_WESOR|nr:uncharacterized protein EI97DRAFT_430135 [Westerdykella ornata]KAF2280401.1 hypothetical protein EI97DRAFT_430135 [Westerdykella ornata]